jgi:dienelactone hydrolase
MSVLLLAFLQTFFSVPGVDAPELAAWGSHQVGVRTLDLKNPAQPDVLNFNKQTNSAPLADRPLKIELWYPAVIPAGSEARTVYESTLPGRNPKPFTIDGKALRNAALLPNQRFPLVIVSHGYPGSRTFLTYLTENLASKGYVVAAIDHTDSVFGEVKGFPSTLANRSNDQHFTIESLSASEPNIDPTRVAIIGYSMGGYGALISAGAMPTRTPPGTKLRNEPNPNVKAIVALAPWGAQPPVSTWEPAALANIKVPSLFIVGDNDDISGYEQGVRKAYHQAINSNRCLLVYEGARHNVGGNPPPATPLDFATKESFDEPVWRKDRLNAINQHFISAFLDLHLKADESRRAYLDGSFKGFQRRWKVGLQQSCLTPAAVPHVPKQSDRPEPASANENGFVSLFDGKTLAGWDGDPKYWRVEDGAIVGEVTPETLLKNNTFLIWRLKQPGDFELKLDYRITEGGNSGINYRSSLLSDRPFALRGYQCDIDGKNVYTGQNYEERGRLFLALRGQTTRVTGDRKPQILSAHADPKEHITPGWNSVHIIARGNTLIHMINGHLMSTVIDDDPIGRATQGLIGVQVHVGPPMKVEYRNLRLKQ